MAVYKGREVIVLGRTDGEDTSPLYTIQHMNGEREFVKLNQIQMTEKEIKESKDGAAWHLDGAQVISDKDLQVLRDKQNRQKIEDNQKKNPQDQDVTVSKIKVPAEELKKPR